jgi:hypothetical protein
MFWSGDMRSDRYCISACKVRASSSLLVARLWSLTSSMYLLNWIGSHNRRYETPIRCSTFGTLHANASPRFGHVWSIVHGSSDLQPPWDTSKLSFLNIHFLVYQAALTCSWAVMSKVAISVSKWKQVTEEEALDDDWDMIPTLTAFAKTRQFCQRLEDNRAQLENLIARHLGVPVSDFVLLGQEHWVWGSFNICLPLDINRTHNTSHLPLQAILRFALPFRCGEEYSPGNVEEKLRCEAATYIWLQRHCPSIPTPRLLAMGFPGIESVCRVLL